MTNVLENALVRDLLDSRAISELRHRFAPSDSLLRGYMRIESNFSVNSFSDEEIASARERFIDRAVIEHCQHVETPEAANDGSEFYEVAMAAAAGGARSPGTLGPAFMVLETTGGRLRFFNDGDDVLVDGVDEATILTLGRARYHLSPSPEWDQKLVEELSYDAAKDFEEDRRQASDSHPVFWQ